MKQIEYLKNLMTYKIQFLNFQTSFSKIGQLLIQKIQHIINLQHLEFELNKFENINAWNKKRLKLNV